MKGAPVFLIFMVLPFLEIAAFIMVGQRIGVLNTILLMALCTLTGIAVLRKQGLGMLGSFRRATSANPPAMGELADGMLVALGGLLLVIPGFITDLAGVLLFIPPVRGFIRRRWSKNFKVSAFATTRSREEYSTFDLSPEDYRKDDRSDENLQDRRQLR